MLGDDLESPGELSVADVAARYESALRGVVSAVGADRVVAEADVDETAVAAIESGDAGGVDLADAAAVLALDPGSPAAETLLAEARDRLLLLMTGAMLDVDTVARDLDTGVDPGELQARIEGRLPMTLDEYARLHHYLAVRAAR